MAGSSREDGPLSLMAVTAKRKSTNVASLADSDHPQVRKTHASLNVSVNSDKRIEKPRGSATTTPIRPPIPNTWGKNPTGPVTHGRTVPKSNFRDHPYSPSKKKKPPGESKNSRKDPDTETRMRPEDEFNRLNEEMTRRSRRDEAIKSRDPHSEETSLNQGGEIRQESAMHLAAKFLSTVKPDTPETGLHSRSSEQWQLEEAPDVVEALSSFADERRAKDETSKPFETSGSNNESDDESSESDQDYEVDTSGYKVSDFSLHHTEEALHRSEGSIPSTSMQQSSSPIKRSQHDNRASGLLSGELVLPKSLHSLVKDPELSVSSRSSFDGSTIETSTHSHVGLKLSSTSLPVPLKSRRSSSSVSSIMSEYERKRKMSSSSQHATVTPKETGYNQVGEVESDYKERIAPVVTYSQVKLDNESEQMSETVSAVKSSWLKDDGQTIFHDSINQWLSTVNPFLRNFFSPVTSIPSYILVEDQENLRHSFLHDLVHRFARHAADTCRADLLTGDWKALSLILSHIDTRCSLLFRNANTSSENDLIGLVQFYEGLVPIWIQAFRVLFPSYKALENSAFPVSQSPDDLMLPIFEERPRTNNFRESIRSDLLGMVFPKALVDYLQNPMDPGTTIAPRQPQVREIDLGTLLLPDAINATMVLLVGRRLAQFFHFMTDDEKLKALFSRSEQFPFRRNTCVYDHITMIN